MLNPEVVQGHTMSQEQFSKYLPCSCQATSHPHARRPRPAASMAHWYLLVNDDQSGARGIPGTAGRGVGHWRQGWLHVKPDVQAVAFLHDVGAALDPQQALGAGRVPATGGDHVVIGDHLGADEASL